MSAYENLKRWERRFIDELCTGCTAAEAFRRLKRKNSNPTDAAYRMMQRPEIKAAIAERSAEIFASVGITQQQVVRQLALAAFGDVRQLLNEVGDFKPLHELSEEAAALIAGVEAEELYEGRGKDAMHIGRVRKIKVVDRIRALEALARIGGMNRDRLEHLGNVSTTPPVIQLVGYDDENPAQPTST